MFCPQCGSKLPDDALFCSSCGCNLGGGASPRTENPTANAQSSVPIKTSGQSFNPALLAIPLAVVIAVAAVFGFGFLHNQNSSPAFKDSYRELLQKYDEALCSHLSMREYEDIGLNYMLSDYSAGDIGYTLIDLDDDDVPELIVSIFGEYTAKNGLILDLYSFKEDAVRKIVSSAERNRYYLCQNGRICNEGSGGADETTWNYYQIGENSSLKKVLQVLYLSSVDGYFAYDESGACEELYDYEADLIFADHSHMSLDLKPLTEDIS